MKLPSLYIAACLAAGILGGPVISTRLLNGFSPAHTFSILLGSALLVLLAGFALAMTRRRAAAWAVSLGVWFLLGGAAAVGEPLVVLANHVTRLIAQGAPGAERLDLTQPLRWRGRLRADPLRLPWGWRSVIELDSVERGGEWTPVAGGLRADLFDDERAQQKQDASHLLDPPGRALQAGDRVEALLRAGPVRNFGDPGAFDYRAFLAAQNIDLLGTLRNAALLTPIAGTRQGIVRRMAQSIARVRGRLMGEIDLLLGGKPDRAAVARAMLLGDRSFLDSDQIEAFQQTGAYHVLVVAGLHVGVLVVALLWICRRLRLPLGASTVLILGALAAYAAMVEDRPPILRAALMAAAFLLGRYLYRRSNLLNAAGLAALVLLAFRPSELSDASFLLSFLAAAVIGGIAVPLFDLSTGKILRALDHVGDVTRDAAFAPAVTQFRLDLRALSNWLAGRLPATLARFAPGMVVAPLRLALWVADLVLLSLAIQTGMLPLMAQYFHRISVVAPAANVPAALLTGIIVPLGFAALLLASAVGGIWPGLAHLAGGALSVAIGALLATVHWFSRASWISYRVPSPPALLIATFFVVALLLAVALLSSRSWSLRASAALATALLLLGGLIAAYPFSPRFPAGQLEITVLDVGQGDSIFVAFPDGRTMLVDGGGLPGSLYVRGSRAGIDIGEAVVSPYLWARGVKRLDVVVLTHGHEDHLGGLPAVLRNFKVAQLWLGRDVDSSAYRALLATARARGVAIAHLTKGEDYDWDGVKIRTLWPPDDDAVKTATNDDSLVLRIEDGRESVLLTGDIERPVESMLAGGKDLLPADFLKVPHHGSRTSSTPAFLDAIHPRFAAISVGAANGYGQPNEEVIERLTAQGARLFRTDRDGAIIASTDGQSFAAHAYLDPR